MGVLFYLASNRYWFILVRETSRTVKHQLTVNLKSEIH